MKYFPKLVWEKIYLSPLNADDAEILTKWMNNPNVTDFIPMWSKIATIQWEKAWLESVSKNWGYTFAIIKKEGDQFIWTIALESIDHINQSAFLWIVIWDFQEHGKWYWRDAINTLLEYAYNTLNLYNISLRVRSFNERAVACYKKVWFKEIWTRHHCIYYNGEWYDYILMEILKSDWQKKNKDILSYDL